MSLPLDPAIAQALATTSSVPIPFRMRTKYVHSTWAQTFTSLPELYIQPESLEEIEHVVNVARKCRRRITTVGCGHSPSSLTCTSSWLVNLDKYNRILAVDEQTGIATMQSGIRLWQLSEQLAQRGLAMPNLGSINHQSIAGAISTGTHGSSLRHGLVSESILSLRITLADGTTRNCSPDEDPELFRASLISLGALGIITEITFRAVPAFSLSWKQVIDTDLSMFNRWTDDLWTHAEFVRVWWFPYTRRAVTWSASKTDAPLVLPPVSYYDNALGYYVYHNLLYLAQYVPRILPWVEWFVFGMQYGFPNGSTTSAVQPSRDALLMNCLYSQFVNEWAIPLHKGPEALRRLSTWLNHLTPDDPDYAPHNIPFSAEGLYVHAPVEVRVSDTSNPSLSSVQTHTRPYLDPTCPDEPTLYLNATLYRPYMADPPCRARYYEAFEWLMRDMGGKPHWAKNFETEGQVIEDMYGEALTRWREVRDEVDPQGMFAGAWHRRYVLGSGAKLELEEIEVGCEKKWSGGVTYLGTTTALLEGIVEEESKE
ncbi:D-arabinono-1,4-lactone oxidase-domain-containing protein [Pseudomassariella vexata]|uniref:D-arabinono-1,4-lactone oxidase n=1 Tax=Pseudomassariella vexata TaxID=1141098 RepID=A0A1Y2E8H1_9PEZI|nr:D-arabinono-1,4-lactone oxidase-domain-containing protein [Pseudomassariella vexata]ORY67614.1 D-arabinono-1,4-lactone oxidase-domain-containing protein [Pseudomassariella vexata]